MSKPFSKQLLMSVEFQRHKVESFKDYPFCLPAIHPLEGLDFHPAMTFFVGENGTGKSTLLEAIAVAWGFNPEGGSKNFHFSTRESHSDLHSYLRLSRGVRKATDGYFLRAESFYNLATEAENLGLAYGSASLHEQSHGESFLSLLLERFEGNGLYLLDEPEAALSPSRQMAALVRLHDLICQGSQFVIATHSPILMAYPDATIFQFSETGIQKIPYEQTEHYVVTKRFINNYQHMLNDLLS